MTSGRYGLVLREVGRLLGGGTVAAMGEGQLLERFAADRDETAFEALVGRHGPMVLGTCRRMLSDPHDVDDAFQATFLVLARRAGSIRDADRLGPWLHGVARRVASRSRALSARRRSRERPGAEDRAVEPENALESAEHREMLDEELARLPEKYRAPLVLCYLEGLTHDEAAEHLRWPVGTVRSRLAGGRDRLRTRLTRRGLAPSAAVPAILPHASMPQALLSTTVRIATSAGSAPARVAILAKGALVAMMWNKLKMIAAVGLMAGVTVGGAGVAAQRGEKGQANVESTPLEKQAARNLDEKERLERELADVKRKLEELRTQESELESEWLQEVRRGGLKDGSQKRIAQLLDDRTRLREEQEAVARKVEELTSRLHQLESSNAEVPTVRELTEMLGARAEDLHKQLEASNDRIKLLEKQLADQRAMIQLLQDRWDKRGKADEAPPARRDERAKMAPIEKPAMEAGKLEAAPVTGGFGDGAGPGVAANTGPQAPQPIVSTLSAGAIFDPARGLTVPVPTLFAVVSAGRDRITMIDSVTQARSTFRLPQSATEITPVARGRWVALRIKGRDIARTAIFDRATGRWTEHDLRGTATEVLPWLDQMQTAGGAYPLIGFTETTPEIRRLIVFDGSDGSWTEQELREPAKDQLKWAPSVGGTSVLYTIGRFLYIYNSPAKKWSVLERKQGAAGIATNINTSLDLGGQMIVPDGSIIHIYDAKTGEWSHIDTKDEK